MIRWIIISVVFGVVGSILAQKKGRSQILWFALCAVVPLLVIAVLMLPAIAAAGVTKKCPHCAEIVKEDATMCKYCEMRL